MTTGKKNVSKLISQVKQKPCKKTQSRSFHSLVIVNENFEGKFVKTFFNQLQICSLLQNQQHLFFKEAGLILQNWTMTMMTKGDTQLTCDEPASLVLLFVETENSCCSS